MSKSIELNEHPKFQAKNPEYFYSGMVIHNIKQTLSMGLNIFGQAYVEEIIKSVLVDWSEYNKTKKQPVEDTPLIKWLKTLKVIA